MGRLGGKKNVHILLDVQNQHVRIDVDVTTNAKWYVTSFLTTLLMKRYFKMVN